MSRSSAFRKSYRRGPKISRKEMHGQPDSFETMRAQSIARRFARQDRRSQPVHCDAHRKLIYDSEEIAISTGEALERVTNRKYYNYKCPRGNHWHLTTIEQSKGDNGVQA